MPRVTIELNPRDVSFAVCVKTLDDGILYNGQVAGCVLVTTQNNVGIDISVRAEGWIPCSYSDVIESLNKTFSIVMKRDSLYTSYTNNYGEAVKQVIEEVRAVNIKPEIELNTEREINF